MSMTLEIPLCGTRLHADQNTNMPGQRSSKKIRPDAGNLLQSDSKKKGPTSPEEWPQYTEMTEKRLNETFTCPQVRFPQVPLSR
mmetsp:Transcript_40203/g.106666  ORF Transcript_40203/g.106666 Transcript_40203/m.106666 type:complete len:84 (+) Transcript_40203:239-490(+)